MAPTNTRRTLLLNTITCLLLRKKKLLLLKKKKQLQQRKERKKRRWGTHPIWKLRDDEGYFHTLLAKMRRVDHDYFSNFTRMSPENFDELVGLIAQDLQKYPPSRKPLSPAHRLAITLRLMASGDSLTSTAFGFRVHKSTVHVVLKETCDALWKCLQPLYLKAPTEATWGNAAYEYGRRWQYPNCCGAVDGKHVVIQQPAKSGSMYYNYKGTNSVVLMAVVDAEYKFLAVDIGGYGSNSDGGVFKASPIGQALVNDTLGLPPPGNLPRTRTSMPHVLLGDEAFQLRPDFMRPFSAKDLTPKTRVFNYRLSRARRCSENAFGILGARWRVFQKPIPLAPNNVDRIIKAAVVLHNYLLTKEKKQSKKVYCPQGFADFTDSFGNYFYGACHDEGNAFRPVNPTASRNFTEEAKVIRNKFADYFWSEEGEVPWQWDMPGVERE